ncbi:hypothetical protein DE146DRAFT_364026 [Phaeosphaeria sp. MPI-PUGE-AT-0046c]|nr:hypothetical protein DE146DRAFT_364026 [Phaeosphaeria sp. MPI-PUGE-AT-0046c]
MSASGNIKRVMSFWFNRPALEWIIAPKGLDAQMKAEFGDLVLQARRNELDEWAAEPEGSVALVSLLDQFSRNLFRGSVDAFSADSKASEIAIRAIARDFDQQVTVIKASAFYMTLMQQENLITTVAARSLWQALKPRCDTEEEHKWVDMGLAASKRHVSQIERFGRFPTRNAILGRKNTEAEELFLQEHKQTL